MTTALKKPRKPITQLGYRLIYRPDHPRTDTRGYVREHLLICERAIGRHLPPGAEVHHVNGDKADNRPGNLVVCQDREYHGLLHRRTLALRESGHAGWYKCWICKQYTPLNLDSMVFQRRRAYHRQCRIEYDRVRNTA